MKTDQHRQEMTSSLQALDGKVHLIERKWGVGKLQQPANTHLLTKFNTQKDRLDSAIVDDDPARVIKCKTQSNNGPQKRLRIAVVAE
jgi:hypothetical protein